jgi:hypothetical protein
MAVLTCPKKTTDKGKKIIELAEVFCIREEKSIR